MKKIKRLLTILAILIFCYACNLLDSEPVSSITVESFWSSEDDAQGALNGMYVDLRDIATRYLYYAGEARSDVLKMGTVGEGGWARYYTNSLNSTDVFSWGAFYTLVNDANLLLKYVPDINFSSENDRNSILAQAYTMRAFTYFVMTRTWGDLIIRTEPTEGVDKETLQKERSSQEDVFEFIKDDIDEALDLYPDNKFLEDRAFWSKPATNALKADIYLWTGKQLNGGDSDIQVALNALNEIETADVSLLDNFEDIFEYSNKGNDEILMSVRFLEDEASNNYFYDMYLIMSAFPSNINDDTYNMVYPPGGNNIVVPTDYIKSLFTEDDSRKDASFYEIYTLDDEGEPTDYYTTVVTKGNGTISSGARLFLCDVILYRYADILLMKAEAKNALGQDPSDEINEVRERAYGGHYGEYIFTSLTQDENDAEILKERLRELAFEGKRWWDLIRFGKAIDMVESISGQEDPEHLQLWPIAEGDLSLETLVEQNPGYN